jgi:CheY-like chemotaxis protein
MKHILVVDDSAVVRGFFKEVFSKQPGYAAEFAPSGPDALDLLRLTVTGEKPPFDFLLTDINMPEMDGFSLIEAAKEVVPDIKAGMITGFNVDDYILMALEKGVYNIICKSDTPAEIMRTVDNLITGENIFGIHNYLAEGAEVHRLKVLDTNGLKGAVQKVLDAARTRLDEEKLYGLKTGLVEMGTNAVYHAYGYEKGTDVVLKDTEEVLMQYGMDEEKLVVVILDTSGSLTKERVLTQLNKGVNPTQEDLIAAGGRGIFLTRFLCDRVIVNIALKQRTEVILIMYFNDEHFESKPILINQI